MAQTPRPPFFFRIFSPNNQGIVYRADKDNGDSYMCTGSRQIGTAGKSIIWELGGYADAMPESAMHSIMGKPKPMTKSQTATFVDENGLGAKYKTMSLYTDGVGYWFAEKSRSRSRSSSSSRSGSGSPRGRSAKSKSRSGRSASRSARSKSKGKSRKNSNRT